MGKVKEWVKLAEVFFWIGGFPWLALKVTGSEFLAVIAAIAGMFIAANRAWRY